MMFTVHDANGKTLMMRKGKLSFYNRYAPRDVASIYQNTFPYEHDMPFFFGYCCQAKEYAQAHLIAPCYVRSSTDRKGICTVHAFDGKRWRSSKADADGRTVVEEKAA